MKKEEREAELQRARDAWLPKSQKGGKPTYEKSSLLGKSEKSEGRAAVRASKRDKDRWK